MKTKICSKCKRELPITDFNKGTNKDGLNSWCRECKKRYNQEHKEEIKETSKKYRKEHKKEIKETKKRYNQEHKEEIKETSKKYRQIHKEELNRRTREYYKVNRIVLLAKQQSYNCRLIKLRYWNSLRGLTMTIWHVMKRRCINPLCKGYSDYGGRGIKVCNEWLGKEGFENFIKDMGYRPSKDYCIHRLDNDYNYCKENCEWILKTEHKQIHRNNFKGRQ